MCRASNRLPCYRRRQPFDECRHHLAVTRPCPTKTQLQAINNLISPRDQEILHVDERGSARFCAASFPTPGDPTDQPARSPYVVNDTSCLLKARQSATGVGDVIYVRSSWRIGLYLVNFCSRPTLIRRVLPLHAAEDKTTENCVITNNVDKPVSGFYVDGVPSTGSSDKTNAVTVTISRGFIAAEDRLYIDNATFTSSTNTKPAHDPHLHQRVQQQHQQVPKRDHR